MLNRIRPAGRSTVAAVVLLLIRGTNAHEHHEDNIPEGEGISLDPIVCPSENVGLHYEL